VTATVPIQLPSERRPARIGQATAVEQSRAIAEVQAAVIVAQQNPRDTQYALQSMRDSCVNPRLAARAFFAFPRGGERVAGPSIHLARELARIWGNISYGVSEMLRDDDHGQSEMQAYAWDLETNARVATGFIVPHKRDTKRGVKTLTDMRDIYENNANNGARRVGITDKQLEERLEKPSSRWTGQDIAQLGTLYTSLQRGEVNRDTEFPAQTGVTAAEIRRERPAASAQAEPAEQRDRRTAERHLFAVLGELGVTDRGDRLAVYSALKATPVATTNDLDPADLESIVAALEPIKALPAEDRQAEIAGLIVDGKKLTGGTA
jgi:hypothetical protein